ncbi:thioredoxin [Clostridium chromiireducens]|uniref:Thioredoxin n=1 Tax=Clostridium chromiireducens TaxID=225345 RepID=A0A964W4F6_9CLOT|nr:thioredoxin family protein [Clostridium chromiireducens]MVX66324.1 thioredoxin [Clostridium chromiireducens]
MSLINKEGSYFTKKNILKGMIVIVIIVAIAGIGYIKNNTLNNDKLADSAGTVLNEGDNSNSEAKIDSENVSENKAQSSEDIISDYISKFDLDATNNFNLEQLKTYGQPMIIDFGSDSCIPCKEMKPVLEELNKELKGIVIVKFVDVWKNTNVAKNLPLKVIPTQFFFDKNGKPYVPKDNESGFTMYSDKTTGEHLFTVHEGGMDKDSILKVLKEMGVE